MDYVARILEGPDADNVATLSPGRIMIGRSDEAQVKLSDASVSWEHAVVTLEGDRFMLENLSAFGTQINNRKVEAPLAVRPGDEIRVSNQTVLKIEAVSEGESAATSMGMGGMLLAGGGLLVVLLLVGWYVLGGPAEDDGIGVAEFQAVELYLADWLEQQVADGHAPQLATVRFRDAGRFELMHEYGRAAEAWSQLIIVLAEQPAPYGDEPNTWVVLAGKHPTALGMLLKKGTAGADDAVSAAAVFQFAQSKFSHDMDLDTGEE